MNDIAELERRITTALERIWRGLDEIPATAARDDENGALRAALAAEQEKTRRLTERVEAIRERQETVVGDLERRVVELGEHLVAAEDEATRLRGINASLSDAVRELREASDPDAAVLDRALRAEAEELRIRRAADLAEVEEILSELRPLIEEQTHA